VMVMARELSPILGSQMHATWSSYRIPIFCASSICQSIPRCNDIQHRWRVNDKATGPPRRNFAFLMTDNRQDQPENVVGKSMAIIGQS
jgi:hypothetical protein